VALQNIREGDLALKAYLAQRIQRHGIYGRRLREMVSVLSGAVVAQGNVLRYIAKAGVHGFDDAQGHEASIRVVSLVRDLQYSYGRLTVDELMARAGVDTFVDATVAEACQTGGPVRPGACYLSLVKQESRPLVERQLGLFPTVVRLLSLPWQVVDLNRLDRLGLVHMGLGFAHVVWDTGVKLRSVMRTLAQWAAAEPGSLAEYLLLRYSFESSECEFFLATRVGGSPARAEGLQELLAMMAKISKGRVELTCDVEPGRGLLLSVRREDHRSRVAEFVHAVVSIPKTYRESVKAQLYLDSEFGEGKISLHHVLKTFAKLDKRAEDLLGHKVQARVQVRSARAVRACLHDSEENL